MGWFITDGCTKEEGEFCTSRYMLLMSSYNHSHCCILFPRKHIHKQVSHRRQRRRLVRYGCENIVHTYTCQACGKPKMRHRLCDDYEKCAQQSPVKYKRAPYGSSRAVVAAKPTTIEAEVVEQEKGDSRA